VGYLGYLFGFGVDVAKCSAMFGFFTIVGWIPPLKRFILGKVGKTFEQNRIKSSYSEVDLIDNAFRAPLPFIQTVWKVTRSGRIAGKLSVGMYAPDPDLYDTESGEKTTLLKYKQAGKPLVLNFGSQS